MKRTLPAIRHPHEVIPGARRELCGRKRLGRARNSQLVSRTTTGCSAGRLRTTSACAERFRAFADYSAARGVRFEYARHLVDAADAGNAVAVMLVDTSSAALTLRMGARRTMITSKPVSVAALIAGFLLGAVSAQPKLRHARAELADTRHLAEHDSLTGLLNRTGAHSYYHRRTTAGQY